MSTETPRSTILYRYNRRYIAIGTFGENTKFEIELVEYKVLRTTPMGYWIDMTTWGPKKEKLVLGGSGKRFAHEKKQDALLSFRKRTEWAMLHSKNNLLKAMTFLEEANQMEDILTPKPIKPFKITHESRPENNGILI